MTLASIPWAIEVVPEAYKRAIMAQPWSSSSEMLRYESRLGEYNKWSETIAVY
jgi:hypothetical protein